MYKKIYSSNNKELTYTTYGEDPEPSESILKFTGCNQYTVTSSHEVNFSIVDGDTLSWLIMMAREHKWEEIPTGFLDKLNDAERFLYELFSKSNF